MTRSVYLLVFCFCMALGAAARSAYIGSTFMALVFFGAAFAITSIYRWEFANRFDTNYWKKPIPLRDHDWSATEQDYEEGDPIGWGATKREAIKDLREQLTNKRAAPASTGSLP